MISTYDLVKFGLYILYILIPILALYFGYTILTKAFRYMGFSPIEAIIIVLVSIIFGFPIIIFGINISNITLFSYNGWIVGISTGGAIIPILLSLYMIIKKKIRLRYIGLGIFIVTVVTYFVTSPEPEKGIVSYFPYFLLPALFACVSSIVLFWKDVIRGAPLAYISSTFGVLIGADFLHLPELLKYEPTKVGTRAIIGGAVVLDMIFITGIIAVLVYGILMYKQRYKLGLY